MLKFITRSALHSAATAGVAFLIAFPLAIVITQPSDAQEIDHDASVATSMGTILKRCGNPIDNPDANTCIMDINARMHKFITEYPSFTPSQVLDVQACLAIYADGVVDTVGVMMCYERSQK